MKPQPSRFQRRLSSLVVCGGQEWTREPLGPKKGSWDESVDASLWVRAAGGCDHRATPASPAGKGTSLYRRRGPLFQAPAHARNSGCALLPCAVKDASVVCHDRLAG